MSTDRIRDIVDGVVRAHLTGIDIRQVEAEHDEGYYGEDVLRVTVTIDSPASAFDGDKLSSLVRHLRPKLAEANEDAFPMVRYRSLAAAE